MVLERPCCCLQASVAVCCSSLCPAGPQILFLPSVGEAVWLLSSYQTEAREHWLLSDSAEVLTQFFCFSDILPCILLSPCTISYMCIKGHLRGCPDSLCEYKALATGKRKTVAFFILSIQNLHIRTHFPGVCFNSSNKPSCMS